MFDSTINKGLTWAFIKSQKNTFLIIGGIEKGMTSCVINNAPVYVLFSDNSKLILRNFKQFGCDAGLFYITGKSKELDQLATKKK